MKIKIKLNTDKSAVFKLTNKDFMLTTIVGENEKPRIESELEFEDTDFDVVDQLVKALTNATILVSKDVANKIRNLYINLLDKKNQEVMETISRKDISIKLAPDKMLWATPDYAIVLSRFNNITFKAKVEELTQQQLYYIQIGLSNGTLLEWDGSNVNNPPIKNIDSVLENDMDQRKKLLLSLLDDDYNKLSSKLDKAEGRLSRNELIFLKNKESESRNRLDYIKLLDSYLSAIR